MEFALDSPTICPQSPVLISMPATSDQGKFEEHLNTCRSDSYKAISYVISRLYLLYL